MIQIATVSGLEFGQTVAFAVVTETVFLLARHGQALDRLDPAARSAGGGGLPRGHRLLLRDSLNLVVDLLYSVLDPRVRLESRAT